MKTIRALYDEKLTEGALRPDADQLRAVEGLEKLGAALVRANTRKTWHRLRGPQSTAITRQGYYFYGSVGRGKSMIMDLFFQSADIQEKRRVHFHAFMLEVHDFLHTRRTERTSQDRIDSDLIACADKIAKESRLLCFDEFQVKDVVDAMILGRLFTALFERGITVVMTSNIAPDDLYADGLQRDRFLPFIELLKKRLNVFHFPGEKDYRLDRLQEGQVYFHPHNETANRELNKIFQALTPGRQASSLELSAKGRVIHVPKTAADVAEFSFSELCEQPKSALDYLELVKKFRVFVVKDVPQLTDARRDATVRFITFIDTLYDHHAHLVVSAAVAAEQLYRGSENEQAFQRTVSRLMEMQSREYRSQK